MSSPTQEPITAQPPILESLGGPIRAYDNAEELLRLRAALTRRRHLRGYRYGLNTS